ncbi:MAG: 4-(cytidine 5'-diphospho)-2-C-methyl-D-erythritol kinase [Deltaproteobacteria bacterium]|nr:4-(cytidine 5'-diphospho)-2-C-methyl-D-erythritol kinase [Deltaproteobacteria bacterium]
MESLVIKAPAKVNLCLKIIKKRPDGYHEISTIFQKIGLFDELTLEKSAVPGICLTVNNPAVPSDCTNLVYRAAELLMRRREGVWGINIKLHKRIPAGAGLGGGSSDAAAALQGLNRLFDLGLSLHDLQQHAISLGADVPFFLSPWPTASADGIGEILQQVNLRTELWFIIVFPRFSISTAWAYATYSKDIILTNQQKNSILPNSIDDLAQVLTLLHNDFEQVVIPRHPEIAAIQKSLIQAGAEGALLSGSGSSVFGVFKNREVCDKAVVQLAKSLSGDIFMAPGLCQE